MPGLGDLVKVLRRFLKAKQAAILHGDGPGCGVCVRQRLRDGESAHELSLSRERTSEREHYQAAILHRRGLASMQSHGLRPLHNINTSARARTHRAHSAQAQTSP